MDPQPRISIEDRQKEDRELKNDCNRVRYVIFSSNGNTRYNSKREAELALEKMLDSWRDKSSKNLVKTINPDAIGLVSYLRLVISQN